MYIWYISTYINIKRENTHTMWSANSWIVSPPRTSLTVKPDCSVFFDGFGVFGVSKIRRVWGWWKMLKYLAFRRWLYTPIIIWLDDWIPGECWFLEFVVHTASPGLQASLFEIQESLFWHPGWKLFGVLQKVYYPCFITHHTFVSFRILM